MEAPPLIARHRNDDCGHIFLIHNPVAIMMAIMIVDAFKIPEERVRVVGIRQTKTDLMRFETLNLRTRTHDRYVNRITGRHLAARRVRRKITATYPHYVVYASWVYPEVEELISSPRCLGHIIFEEGQQSYYRAPSYRPGFFNSWFFRRPRILAGSTSHYFRNDASAFISLSSEAFPLMPQKLHYVLSNIESVARHYEPRLQGIPSIGLMPAPRRLAPGDVIPAIDKLIQSMEGKGVIKMHPGFLSESAYSPEKFATYIAERSKGRLGLCSDDVLVEIEMLIEKKRLYGARTSLSRYAEMLGSSFVLVEFDNYIAPII